MKELRKAQIILRATFIIGLAITLLSLSPDLIYFFFARFSHDRLWGLVILASALLVSKSAKVETVVDNNSALLRGCSWPHSGHYRNPSQPKPFVAPRAFAPL